MGAKGQKGAGKAGKKNNNLWGSLTETVGAASSFGDMMTMMYSNDPKEKKKMAEKLKEARGMDVDSLATAFGVELEDPKVKKLALKR